MGTKDRPLFPLSSIEQTRSRFRELLNDEKKIFSQYDSLSGELVTLPYQRLISSTDWDSFLSTLENIDGFIGMGKDRIIVKTPGDPNTILSVFHEPQDWSFLREVKKMNTILVGLFPHNFPKIRGFFGCNNIYENNGFPEGFYYTGFKSDFIKGTKAVKDCRKEGFFEYYWNENDFWLDYQEKGTSSQSTYPFQMVLDVMNQIGLPLRKLGFDLHADNFILGEDGGEYYTDIISSPYFSSDEQFAENWASDPSIEALNKLVYDKTLSLSHFQLKRITDELSALDCN